MCPACSKVTTDKANHEDNLAGPTNSSSSLQRPLLLHVFEEPGPLHCSGSRSGLGGKEGLGLYSIKVPVYFGIREEFYYKGSRSFLCTCAADLLVGVRWLFLCRICHYMGASWVQKLLIYAHTAIRRLLRNSLRNVAFSSRMRKPGCRYNPPKALAWLHVEATWTEHSWQKCQSSVAAL